MIRINLLPDEYRRKAKTPLKLMLGVTTAVAVNTTALAWLAWMFFAVEAQVSSERASLQTDMDGLSPQVAYHRSLENESRGHRSREETLAEITNSRISWTRKLDELIDVVNRGGSGQDHLIWLDDLTVSQRGSGGRGGAGELKASGHSGSDRFAQVANFLQDLEESTFIEDFHPPGSPEGSESLIDEELVPSVVWAFPLALDLKSPEERK